MIYRWLIILSYLCCQSMAWSYTKSDIHLTNNEFMTRVKPQLNNIRQDYQSLLGLLTPSLKPYKPIFGHFNDIKSKEDRFNSYCKTLANPNCSAVVSYYLEHISGIIQNLENSPTPQEIEFHPLDQQIAAFDEFQKFRSQLLDLYMQLFHYHFFYQAEIAPTLSPQDFNKIISKAYNQFNIFLIKSTDVRFQEQFMSFWNSFIKPISFYVMSNNEKSYFIAHLNDYNLRWNMLNVELTKRNKKTSKQVNTLLKIMHNRWNNILKITLR